MLKGLHPSCTGVALRGALSVQPRCWTCAAYCLISYNLYAGGVNKKSPAVPIATGTAGRIIIVITC
jgi:hypothetical protein